MNEKNKNNMIQDESKAFAIRIINLYKYLRENKHELVLSKQLLRSGTSIGANISESVFGQSDMDFISKLSIALKESNETRYWLELLHETNYLDDKQFISIYDDCEKIKATLINIINTTKKNRKNH
ncbi:MAG: four helix bundle protein [Bacteroidales bacterium]|nr:four helix bundle protein [Bacteroidaceae bacterium]MBQ9884164.1 four helix bundle protein [Bacteroidaceae bacterium]MBR1941763.1 four helix bundle protein [Bacteroidaceae bacterium]MDO4185646.1 four helix bundle protein [Bacteroidales bacterium]